MMVEPLKDSLGSFRDRLTSTVKELWPRRNHAVRVPIYAVQILADLTPVVRMAGLRRLPDNFATGIIGAEAAT